MQAQFEEIDASSDDEHTISSFILDKAFSKFQRIILSNSETIAISAPSFSFHNISQLTLWNISFKQAKIVFKNTTSLSKLYIIDQTQQPVLPLLAKIPTLKQLKLSLYQFPKQQIQLFSSLNNLQKLEFSPIKIEQQVLKLLLAHLPYLKSFGSFSAINQQSMEILGQFKLLEEVTFFICTFSLDLMGMFIRSFSYLRRLEFKSCQISDEHVEIISKNMKRLEGLSVPSNRLTQKSIIHLKDLRSDLKQLSIYDNLIDFRHEGIDFKHLEYLNKLEVSHNNFNDIALLNIACNCLRLKEFIMWCGAKRECDLTEKGWEAFLKNTKQLEVLELHYGYNDRIAQVVFENLKNLNELCLDGRRDLSDTGCYQIARVGRERRKLRRVKVDYNRITDRGALKLVKNLRETVMSFRSNTGITRKGKRNIALVNISALTEMLF